MFICSYLLGFITIDFSYPTKQQVLDISVLIVKTYPFLKDRSVGTGYVSN